MFPNLKAEMARKNVSTKVISITLNLSSKSVLNKLSGKTEFNRAEMAKIKNELFPDLSMDYLFEEQKPENRTS